MNIYNAIMKAADHIERNPKDFDFGSIDIPHACGSPGCALGWIGHFAGVKATGPVDYRYISLVSRNPDTPQSNYDYLGVTHLFGEVDQTAFYARMDALVQHWRYDASICARGLRLYAEKYHGEEKPKPVSPPDWNAIAANWTIGDDVRSQEIAA